MDIVKLFRDIQNVGVVVKFGETFEYVFPTPNYICYEIYNGSVNGTTNRSVFFGIRWDRDSDLYERYISDEEEKEIPESWIHELNELAKHEDSQVTLELARFDVIPYFYGEKDDFIDEELKCRYKYKKRGIHENIGIIPTQKEISSAYGTRKNTHYNFLSDTKVKDNILYDVYRKSKFSAINTYIPQKEDKIYIDMPQLKEYKIFIGITGLHGEICTFVDQSKFDDYFLPHFSGLLSDVDEIKIRIK